MRRKLYPINILSRANHILTAWDQFGTSVTIGNLTQKSFAAEMTQADLIEAQIREAEIKLTALRSERDSLYLSLWDKVKRVYEGVAANFGYDSMEYEMVGRTRASKRKRRSRQTPVHRISPADDRR